MDDIIDRYRTAVNRADDNRSREILYELLILERSYHEKLIKYMKSRDEDETKPFDENLVKINEALTLAWVI